MSTEFRIRLDQFLKLAGQYGTGGQAKLAIQAGGVQVNGQVETRRGRQLVVGDVVACEGQSYVVEVEDDAQSGG